MLCLYFRIILYFYCIIVIMCFRISIMFSFRILFYHFFPIICLEGPKTHFDPFCRPNVGAHQQAKPSPTVAFIFLHDSHQPMQPNGYFSHARPARPSCVSFSRTHDTPCSLAHFQLLSTDQALPPYSSCLCLDLCH